jgi:hypothetical protein
VLAISSKIGCLSHFFFLEYYKEKEEDDDDDRATVEDDSVSDLSAKFKKHTTK